MLYKLWIRKNLGIRQSFEKDPWAHPCLDTDDTISHIHHIIIQQYWVLFVGVEKVCIMGVGFSTPSFKARGCFFLSLKVKTWCQPGHY